MVDHSSHWLSGRVLLANFLVCGAVVFLWLFPALWCKTQPGEKDFLWLSEQAVLDGWTYREMAIPESSRAELGSDRFVSGEFTRADGRAVTVFSAKTYDEKSDDMSVFAHNPDRCWPQMGWKLRLVQPEVVTFDLSGKAISFERRCFEVRTRTELVYFGALIGGKPLPYRLDQFLTLGLKGGQTEGSGTFARASDPRFWGYIWSVFRSRQPLRGAKHFIRISTSVENDQIGKVDQLLREFLTIWLRPGDSTAEVKAWKARR